MSLYIPVHIHNYTYNETTNDQMSICKYLLNKIIVKRGVVCVCVQCACMRVCVRACVLITVSHQVMFVSISHGLSPLSIYDSWF